MIARAAYLLDIGKMAIPSEILFKPGKLDGQAFRRSREGENILCQAPGHLPACRWRPARTSRRTLAIGPEMSRCSRNRR
jgi:hypothetical protein